jgi:hypothetical protein
MSELKEQIQAIIKSVESLKDELNQGEKNLSDALTRKLDSLKNAMSEFRVADTERVEILSGDISKLREDIEEISQKKIVFPDFKKEVDQLETNLSKVTSSFKNKEEELEKKFKGELTKLNEDIESLRGDTMRAVAHRGGGNANRNILVNSNPSTLSRYTDLNLIAASTISLTYTNNDTLKTTDLTVDLSGNRGRWIKPYHWGVVTTGQAATAGRVLLSEFEVTQPVVLGAIIVNHASSIVGSVICGIYGPIPTEETCLNASVLAQSAITDCVGTATQPQSILFQSSVLAQKGRYYAATQFSSASEFYLRNSNTTQVVGWVQFYNRSGGFGALTDPCPAVTETGSAAPGNLVRIIP